VHCKERRREHRLASTVGADLSWRSGLLVPHPYEYLHTCLPDLPDLQTYRPLAAMPGDIAVRRTWAEVALQATKMVSEENAARPGLRRPAFPRPVSRPAVFQAL